MKIALIGYGKMGKEIEQIALSRGHEVVLKISLDNIEDCNSENLKKADVAIEFTAPHAALQNMYRCFEAAVPVVVGTTGWYKHLEEVKKECKKYNATLLYASNFSIGVNLFFALNKKLAQLMAPYRQYDVTIEEIHHTQKLDAPSGTAITLANDIIAFHPTKKQWSLEKNDKENLYIKAKRIDPCPGTHSIKYSSDIDDIEIIHTAHNRKGFATGAVLAAEWLVGKNGIFTMNDVLNIA
ncbi:MAG: 4-hydroxy-tetrahydrodipicolinate reductase [Bacteroidia bacterium]